MRLIYILLSIEIILHFIEIYIDLYQHELIILIKNLIK